MATPGICKACQDDKGFCVYCQQDFEFWERLHNHIARAHKGSIRYWNCDVRKEK